jgi:hypothetical protein
MDFEELSMQLATRGALLQTQHYGTWAQLPTRAPLKALEEEKKKTAQQASPGEAW